MSITQPESELNFLFPFQRRWRADRRPSGHRGSTPRPGTMVQSRV